MISLCGGASVVTLAPSLCHTLQLCHQVTLAPSLCVSCVYTHILLSLSLSLSLTHTHTRIIRIHTHPLAFTTRAA